MEYHRRERRWRHVRQPIRSRTPPVAKAEVVGKLTVTRFTLIELLVVVAIIGVLVSMLLPALRRAKGYAQGSVCMGNLKQVLLGFELYKSEWNGYYPVAGLNAENTGSMQNPNGGYPGWTTSYSGTAAGTANANFYPFLLNSYMTNSPNYANYADGVSFQPPAASGRVALSYFCPADRYEVAPNKPASYAGMYSVLANGHSPGSQKWTTMCFPSPIFETVKISRDSVILLGEVTARGSINYMSLGAGEGFNGDPYTNSRSGMWNYRFTLGSLPNYCQYDQDTAYSGRAYTHPGGLNYAYLDMHVARAISPTHAIWGSPNFMFDGSAVPAFNSLGFGPLR